jgi:SAM-dependent methyltransferase
MLDARRPAAELSLAMDDVKPASVTETVREYYGRVLKSSADLKTSACCLAEALPAHVAFALKDVHPEVKERFYGCGSPVPPALDGITVLDLGCGSGRDCYVLSKLVGPKGRVVGLDMTGEQLAVARRHQAWHAERFGWANTEFRQGYIEELGAAGIAGASVDLVISNCVLNLSPDKPRVFGEIFRVLKPGGELYFSDVFADRRIPRALAQDPVLLGECLGGALYLEDFRRLMARAGCLDARVVSSAPLALNSAELEGKVGNIRFSSVTVRAFRLDLEDRCEDFGQVATYLGNVPESPHAFVLDDHHRFEAGKPMLVCGNTADMIQRTRYARHFRVQGDQSVHYGLFDCGPSTPAAGAGAAPKAGCC